MNEIMGAMVNDKKPEEPKNDALEMLDSPWLRNQVETHLVFGVLARYYPSIFDSYYVRGASNYQKRALLLAATKFSGLIISFLFLLGSVITFLKKDPDAPAVLILGFTWMPALEFVPKITPKQKYITIVRLIITFFVWYIWIRV